MAYIQCNHCGKETEDINAFGIKVENCIWCDEPLRKNPKNSQTDENIIEKVDQDIRRGNQMAFTRFKKK